MEYCGERLKKIRLELDLKQSELAARLSVKASTISEIETGKYNPNYEILYYLAHEFKVNLYYLMFGEGEMFSREPEFQFHYRNDNIINKTSLKQFLFYLENSNNFQLSIMKEYLRISELEKEAIEKDLYKFETEQKDTND